MDAAEYADRNFKTRSFFEKNRSRPGAETQPTTCIPRLSMPSPDIGSRGRGESEAYKADSTALWCTRKQAAYTAAHDFLTSNLAKRGSTDPRRLNKAQSTRRKKEKPSPKSRSRSGRGSIDLCCLNRRLRDLSDSLPFVSVGTPGIVSLACAWSHTSVAYAFALFIKNLLFGGGRHHVNQLSVHLRPLLCVACMYVCVQHPNSLINVHHLLSVLCVYGSIFGHLASWGSPQQ